MGEIIALDEARGEGGLGAIVRKVHEFKGGWGAQLFRHKPHWFDVTKGWSGAIYLDSLCGLSYDLEPNAYIAEAGNYPKCKKCLEALRRKSVTPCSTSA